MNNFRKESKSGFFFWGGGRARGEGARGGGGHVLKPKQFARLEGEEGEEDFILFAELHHILNDLIN